MGIPAPWPHRHPRPSPWSPGHPCPVASRSALPLQRVLWADQVTGGPAHRQHAPCPAQRTRRLLAGGGATQTSPARSPLPWSSSTGPWASCCLTAMTLTAAASGKAGPRSCVQLHLHSGHACDPGLACAPRPGLCHCPCMVISAVLAFLPLCTTCCGLLVSSRMSHLLVVYHFVHLRSRDGVR